jgi:hypothetical protein
VDPGRARVVLGVDEDADPTTIRLAYRRLMRVTHPDVAERPDATERAIELSAALEILMTRPTASTDQPQARAREPEPRAAPPPPNPFADARPAQLDTDTIGVSLPPDEALLLVIEAAHQLGDIAYLDPSNGLVEVLVEFVEAPTASLLLTLQGRATGITEVMCSVEPLSGGELPPNDAVTRLLVDTLAACAAPPAAP